MACNFYVPGPAQIAVGTGASGALEFLGHTRDGAHVREDLFTEPVICDIAGSRQPADMLALGKLVTVSLVIVRYDPAVMTKLNSRYIGGSAGALSANEIGTLMLSEDKTFKVAIKSTYQSKTIFTNYLAGIRLLWAFLDQGHDFNLSTSVQEHQMTFLGLMNVDPATLTGTCWDSDMTGFPTVT